MCAIVVVFVSELAGHECRLRAGRGKLVLLVLDPDDLGLDWRSRVRHWGCVGLIVEVRLIRYHRMLPRMEGQMLPGLSKVGVVCNLLEVLLWFSVAGVMCRLLGMLLRIHWVLLPVVRRCAFTLGHNRADDWPRRDNWSAWDRIPACC